MQTTIQFGASSTLQEWSNFKGVLSQMKKQEKPLLKSESNAENLIMHLAKQLQAEKF